MKKQFTYPNFTGSIETEGYPDYAQHSGQIVEVVEEIPGAFEDCDGNECRGFKIRADDGWEGVVWPGELRDPDPARPAVTTNYCVGWNIPGYLPDADETYIYATFEEARAGIIDELHRAADDYGDECEALRTPYELAIAEFEAATEPRTVMVNDYAWWIEPTTDPVTGE